MPDSTPAITIDHVSKLFRRQKQRTFKEMLPALLGGKAVVDSFWALNDINLTINRGETVGIIGPNGSGKSTLLKLIADVSQPTKGKITVNGRIAPLIELGAGFHPELTGRENVYLNGVILGMSRAEVRAKFDDIVNFAELWDFIDQPVKHYSSGMYLRLAFAVAVHTDPEILLVDEILAVGDMRFQRKCLDLFPKFKQSGKTIIFVSHSMPTVAQFCDRVMIIEKGLAKHLGQPAETIRRYQLASNVNSDTAESTVLPGEFKTYTPEDRPGDKKILIRKVSLVSDGKKKSHFSSSDKKIQVNVECKTNVDTKEIVFGVSIFSIQGDLLFGTNTLIDGEQVTLPHESTFSLGYSFDNVLKSGDYTFQVGIFAEDGTQVHDFIDRQFIFSIDNNHHQENGSVIVNHSWQLP